MGSNKGNRTKHSPAYTDYKQGTPGKSKKAKARMSKKIQAGMKRAEALRRLASGK